ncbi:hypothetical protein L2E82_22634 [Cichorium intybus]|uniref:Uncharacterized protein n=1 Tax=Cichorium intybus TaxID=13427 RepID=A0ACB9DYH7_CICIN|nr:hypothetical protein L2E82_22634 [Cichorium intybus]
MHLRQYISETRSSCLHPFCPSPSTFLPPLAVFLLAIVNQQRSLLPHLRKFTPAIPLPPPAAGGAAAHDHRPERHLSAYRHFCCSPPLLPPPRDRRLHPPCRLLTSAVAHSPLLLTIRFNCTLPLPISIPLLVFGSNSSRVNPIRLNQNSLVVSSNEQEKEKNNEIDDLMVEVISIVLIVVITTTLLLLRILYVISQSNKPIHNNSQKHLSTLVVLGSGGHTAEMINLLSVMQPDRFSPRFYIAAATDNMSLQKARVFENNLNDKILCNGPGTCIPICAVAFIFKVLGIRWSNIFYVESIARVKRLSLSGLLLYKLHMADQLFCLNGLHPYGPPLKYIVASVHHHSPLSVLTLGPLRVAVYPPPLLPSWSASPPAIALHHLRQSACRFAGKGI